MVQHPKKARSPGHADHVLKHPTAAAPYISPKYLTSYAYDAYYDAYYAY